MNLERIHRALQPVSCSSKAILIRVLSFTVGSLLCIYIWYVSFRIGTSSPTAAAFLQTGGIFPFCLNRASFCDLCVLTESKIDWRIDHLAKRCAVHTVYIGQMHEQQTQTDVASYGRTARVSASPIRIDLALVYLILAPY